MTTAGILLILLGTTVVTALASLVVFRSFEVEMRRRHLEVGTAIFLQLGVIYAVFLAFVFGQALTSFVAADDAIYAECAALHGAAILGTGLSEPSRTKVAEAMESYTTAVIGREWRTMREARAEDPVAFAREGAMLKTANGLEVSDPKDIRIAERVVTALIEAHKNREERIFQAGQGIPAGLWAMILIYCAALIGLVLFSSLEYALSHAILSGLFGALNVLVLLAVFVLQYPFEGPFRLSPNNFEMTQAKIVATFAK